jgi:hypothetical protein
VSITEVDRLIGEYRRRGLVLDANLLLLFVVGLRSAKRVERNSRLRGDYTPNDAELLFRFCELFDRIVTTPHILTETCDLLRDRDDRIQLGLMIRAWREEFLPSLEVVEQPAFAYLGLADTAILDLAGKYLILSDDGQLVTEVLTRQGGALEFAWVRAIAG